MGKLNDVLKRLIHREIDLAERNREDLIDNLKLEEKSLNTI